MEIVFGYKPLMFFVKISKLDVWLVTWDASKNTFYVLLVKILHLGKKHLIYTPVCLSLLFQEKMLLIKKELGGQVVLTRGRWNI